MAQREHCNVAHFCSQILVETGHIGRQASASVMVTDGETVSRHNLVSLAYYIRVLRNFTIMLKCIQLSGKILGIPHRSTTSQCF